MRFAVVGCRRALRYHFDRVLLFAVRYHQLTGRRFSHLVVRCDIDFCAVHGRLDRQVVRKLTIVICVDRRALRRRVSNRRCLPVQYVRERIRRVAVLLRSRVFNALVFDRHLDPALGDRQLTVSISHFSEVLRDVFAGCILDDMRLDNILAFITDIRRAAFCYRSDRISFRQTVNTEAVGCQRLPVIDLAGGSCCHSDQFVIVFGFMLVGSVIPVPGCIDIIVHTTDTQYSKFSLGIIQPSAYISKPGAGVTVPVNLRPELKVYLLIAICL